MAEVLPAGTTIQGIAGTGSAMTYTVTYLDRTIATGAFVAGSVQGQLPTGAVGVLMPAVPAGHEYTNKKITLSNTTGSAVAGIRLYMGGASATNQITGTLSAVAQGSIIVADDGIQATDATGALLTTSPVTLSGDATGSGAGTVPVTVVALQGRAVSASTPGVGNALVWNGSAWSPTSVVAGISALDAAVAITGTATNPIIGLGRLDQIATLHPPTSAVNVNGQLISGGATPIAGTDLAIKSYVDSVASGVLARHYAQAVATTNQALTGLPTIDTITLTAGQIALLTAQSTPSQNGLWAVASGAWARPSFFATGSDAVGSYVIIQQGSATWLGTEWFLTGAGPIVVDTTAETWVQVNGLYDVTVDSTLTKTGNQITRAAITSDVSIPAGSNVATLATFGPGAIGPIGDASHVAAVTLDAKGRVSGLTSVLITPAAIGAPSGTGTHSGTSSGNNTGDQAIVLSGDSTGTWAAGVLPVVNTKIQGRAVVATAPGNGAVYQWVAANSDWEPFTYAGDVGGGPSASVVRALQGVLVSGTVPNFGMDFRYGPSSWQPTRSLWNVLNFGADPTANSDSTLAIYNAIISCGITAGAQQVITTGTPTTSTSNFAVSVTANASFPTSGTGTLIAMTTRGLVYMTFSGGTTSTLTCAVTAGVAGGVILSGSIMGVASTTQIGGIIYFPSGLYLTTQEITNSIPGIWFMGDGAAANADVGNWGYSGGSWLYYNGPIGGTVLRCVPISGTAGLQAGQNLKGIRMSGLGASCGGTSLGYGYASHGFQLISCDGFDLEDLYVLDPAFAAYDFTTLGASMLSEAEDCTRGTGVNLRFRCIEGPAATAAQMSAAAAAITAGAGSNLNALAGGSATPTFVRSTTGINSGSTSATGTLAAGPAQGNTLIATVGFTGAGSITGVPTGWLLLHGPDNPASANFQSAIYYKIAGASEPSSWVWTLNAAAMNVVAVSEYSGCSLTVAPLIAAGTGSGASVTTPTLTTTVNGCAIVGVVMAGWSLTTGAFTAPGSTTQDSQNSNAVSLQNNDGIIHFHDTTNQAAAGVTTARTVGITVSAAQAEAYTVALTPAPTGSATISTAALTAAAWPTAGPGGVGLAQIQAVDQLTGNVMWYLLTYTGNAGPGLTGVQVVPLWWNQANATTLAAAAPATGNAKPNALLFTGAIVRPAYAAWAQGMCMHGSLTANTSVNTFLNCNGVHWMGEAAYLGNCDSNLYENIVWNRSTAGTPTGAGWDVQGATAIGGATAVSRNHHWISGDAGLGGVRIRGTGEYGGTAAYTVAATPNYWDGYELGNGAPVPVVGTGALFPVWFNGTARVGGVGTPPTAAQALTAGSANLLTGSSIPLPTPLGLIAGFSWYRWYININKTTAAGVATWTIAVKVGTANTTADAAVATFTSGVNTGAVDQAVCVLDCYVTSTTAVACTLSYMRAGVLPAAATGLGTMPQVPGTTAAYTAGIANPNGAFIHVDVTPGAAAVMTAVAQAEVMR